MRFTSMSGRHRYDIYHRQLQEKCREEQCELFAVFVDRTEAFDSVDKFAVWQILIKIGCPIHFVNIIRSFHDGMRVCVIKMVKSILTLT